MDATEGKPRLITVPRLLFAGASRGVGTSTVTLGAHVALRRQGISVGSAKVGPSLVEPTHHRRVLGRLAYSLDPWSLTAQGATELLARVSAGADLVVFEGEGGCFDDFGASSSFRTNVAAAELMGAPIVLVIDARGYRESIRALLHGYKTFDPRSPLRAVVANRVDGPEHAALVRRAAEDEGLVFAGAIPHGDPHATAGSMSGVHLNNPSLLTRNRVVGTGNLVEGGVNLSLLREIAASAQPLPYPDIDPPVAGRVCRIGVADDQAFHLTNQDNLDLIRRAGAELAAFSPITDRKLPKRVSGLYLPGGYVHLYAQELHANKQMHAAIREFLRSGGFVYAEGGALPYLCRRIVLFNGSSYEMAGVFPAAATAVMADDAEDLPLYCEAHTVRSSAIAPTGVKIRGIRERRWSYLLEEPLESCISLHERDGQADVPIEDGFIPSPRFVATRLHLHWGSEPRIARWFVDAVCQHAAMFERAVSEGEGNPNAS